MKFLMDLLVFVQLDLIESMESAINAKQEQCITSQLDFVIIFVKPMKFSIQQLKSVSAH